MKTAPVKQKLNSKYVTEYICIGFRERLDSLDVLDDVMVIIEQAFRLQEVE